MTEEEYLRGAERTYTLAAGGVSATCTGIEARHLAVAAWRTQRTLIHMPGERNTAIPDEVMGLFDAITELRGLPSSELPDAQARQDLLECEVERYEHLCFKRLHRKLLYGTYHWRRPLDECLPFGEDTPPQPSWLIMVIVPPKIRSCTVTFDPFR
jgi:hypothetical protein